MCSTIHLLDFLIKYHEWQYQVFWLALLYSAGWNSKWYSYFGKLFGNIFKIKPALILRSRKPSPKVFTLRILKTYVHTKTHKIVYGSLFFMTLGNCPKLETIQMAAFSKGIYQQTAVHLNNLIILRSKKRKN